jgi:chromosome partitioning protein
MHITVALMKAGQRVATIDLDPRQRSFTRYIENRRAWARQVGLNLEIPDHLCFDEKIKQPAADDEVAACEALTDAVAELAGGHDYVVLDTAGHYNPLMRLAHLIADTLITPLNDSFVDLDVLGIVDPEASTVTGTSHYARLVGEARRERQQLEYLLTDWIVLRNRLSPLGSRNKRLVGERLEELSRRLDFRYVEGLAERVIYREFYPRGLTALDAIDAATLGTRPTLSHVTARLEIEKLLKAMSLGDLTTSSEMAESKLDAA